MAFIIMVVIPLIPIVIGFCINMMIRIGFGKLKKVVENEENAVRSKAMQTQQKIQNYLNQEGCQPLWRMTKYIQNMPEFCEINQLKYKNPYKEELDKANAELDEASKEHVDESIDYWKLIGMEYALKVSSVYETQLPGLLESIDMFDMEQLYYEFPQFQPLFTSDPDLSPEEKIDVSFIKEMSNSVINDLVLEGKFRRIGNDDVYQTTRSGSPSNMSEEHTWDDSDFDD